MNASAPRKRHGNKMFLGAADMSIFLQMLRSRRLEPIGDAVSHGGKNRVMEMRVQRADTKEPAGTRWGWFCAKTARWEIFLSRPAHILDAEIAVPA